MKKGMSIALAALAVILPTASSAQHKDVNVQSQNTVTASSGLISPESKTVIDLVNAERKKLGLRVLRENVKLSRAAQRKANDMNTKQYWAHTSPVGLKGWDFIRKEKYLYETAGENLAMGFSAHEEAVNAWMTSPSHRTNILDRGFVETGVGIVSGVYEGKPTFFIVQLFTKPYAPRLNAPPQY